jgi:alpha-galactosidase
MSIANSWRMSGDIYNSFTRPDALCSCDDERDPQCIAPGTHCSLLFVLNHVSAYADKARPGAWNDLDILQVGIGGMTDEEVGAYLPNFLSKVTTLRKGALRDRTKHTLPCGQPSSHLSCWATTCE